MPEDNYQRFRRLFTVEEADALIPLLTEYVAEIRENHRKMIAVAESKAELSKGNGRVVVDVDELKRDISVVSDTAGRIRDLVEKIDETGAKVTDLETGLVDFPHQRKGRIVYLCWKPGEDRIRYWHDLNTGAVDRKPL